MSFFSEKNNVQVNQLSSQMAQSMKKAFVSVTDFGAKLDGVTDDTLALQEAIAYCKLNKKSLYVPAGTLLFNQQIRLFNGFKMFGSGMTQSTLKYNGTEDFALGYKYAFENYELEDVSLSDFGMTTTNKLTDLLYFNYSRFSDFRNLMLTGGKNGVHIDFGWVLLFDNCHVRYNEDYGFLMDSKWQGALNLINIEHCTIEQNKKAGVIIAPTLLDAGQGVNLIRNKIQYNGTDETFADRSQVIVKGQMNTNIIGNYFEPLNTSTGSLLIIGGGTGSVMTNQVNIKDNFIGTATNIDKLASVIELRDRIKDINIENNSFANGTTAPIIKSQYYLLNELKLSRNFYLMPNPYHLIDGNVVNNIKDYTPSEIATLDNNFVVDGDFENGTFSFTLEGTANAWIDSTAVYSGTKAFYITTDSSANKVAFPVRGLRQNASNVLSLFVKNNTASVQTFKADIYDVDSVLLGSISYSVGAYSPFTLITIPFTSANKTDKTITVKFYGGNFYIDRLRVTEGKSVNSTARNAFDSYMATSTAGRPTTPFQGQMVFDRTLNKPIWCKTVSPVVWVDSAGTTV
jgi:hypothetical protein